MVPFLFRSIASNWLLVVLAIAVNFLITPVVVDRLAAAHYGAWTFMNDLAGHSALLFFGLGPALIRQIAAARQAEDESGMNDLVSTIVLTFGGLGLVCTVVMFSLSPFVGEWILRNPATGDLHAISVAAKLLGVQLFLMFAGTAFVGILQGFERFDLLNLANGFTLILRTIVIWWSAAGQAEQWLINLAVITTAAEGCRFVLLYLCVRAVTPATKIWPFCASMAVLRQLLKFAGGVFVIQVSARLINYTDTVVIGIIVGASAVGYYSIAASFVIYGLQVTGGVTSVFMPRMTREFNANSDSELTETYIRCASTATMVGLFISASTCWLGEPFIRIWISAEFADQLGTVIVLLMLGFVGQVFYGQAPIALFQARGELRRLAQFRISEGVCNLVLSCVLGFHFGIEGVAGATLASGLLIGLGLTPYHTSKALGIPLTEYAFRTLRCCAPSAIAVVATYATLFHFARPSSYALIVTYGTAGGVVFFACWWCSAHKEDCQ